MRLDLALLPDAGFSGVRRVLHIKPIQYCRFSIADSVLPIIDYHCRGEELGSRRSTHITGYVGSSRKSYA